jgi:MFS family permease
MKNTDFIDDTFSNLNSSNQSLPVVKVEGAEKQKESNIFKIKNANIVLAILCTCAFFQNMLVGGANNAILTTIERAFYMKSIESALFLSCYDIGNILTSPFISYLGDRNFKPKIIGLSMIGLSIGSTLMTIPKFFNFDYSDLLNNNNNNLNSNELTCNKFYNSTLFNESKANSNYTPKDSSINEMKYIFYIANTINGISSVALYTIVISYIENIFEKGQFNFK